MCSFSKNTCTFLSINVCNEQQIVRFLKKFAVYKIFQYRFTARDNKITFLIDFTEKYYYKDMKAF